MKWLSTAGITDLRFKIKTLTGKHELTGKKGKIMYKYDAKSLKAEEFINDEEIRETLAYADANKDNVELIDAIIAKARERKGLNHREASVLLACQIPEKIEEVYALAQQIKKDFYGNRIVLFAPLYLSNYCVNGCVYCPYHHEKQAHCQKEADTGGDREGSHGTSGYGTQASGNRGRRRSGEQSDRIYSGVYSRRSTASSTKTELSAVLTSTLRQRRSRTTAS